MKKFVVLALIALAASQSRAWRCNTSLVEAGDSQTQVLAACGKPAARFSQQVAYQLEIGNVHHRRRYQTIDFWVYISGANTFSRILYFEDGELKTIRDGSYGRDYDRDRSNCQRDNSNIELNQTKPELELRCGPADATQLVEEYSRAVVLNKSNRVLKRIVVDEWRYYGGKSLRVYRFENGVLTWQGDEDADRYKLLD